MFLYIMSVSDQKYQIHALKLRFVFKNNYLFCRKKRLYCRGQTFINFFLWSKPLGYYNGMSAKHLDGSARSNRVTTGIFYISILQVLFQYTQPHQ